MARRPLGFFRAAPGLAPRPVDDPTLLHGCPRLPTGDRWTRPPGVRKVVTVRIGTLGRIAHARVALGATYLRLKDYVRARQELETAVKLDPGEPTAHYNLALLYARIKEPERAQEELRIVEQLKAKGASTGGGVVVLPPKSNP